jgi:hypothetical protein
MSITSLTKLIIRSHETKVREKRQKKARQKTFFAGQVQAMMRWEQTPVITWK